MPTRLLTILAVALAAVTTAPAAVAQNTRTGLGAQVEVKEVFTSISPIKLADILGAETGSISVTPGDDVTLSGRVDSKNYDVFFYECDGGEFASPAKENSSCLGFEYRAVFEGYPNDSDTVNQYNNDFHYGTLWRDEQGDLALQLNVVVEGGVSEDNIRITFAWWRGVLNSFDDFMDGR